jgi:hypothetical protein
MDSFGKIVGGSTEKLKIDLHVHTALDPIDNLPLDIESTITLAAAHGYDVIALTHHDAYFHITDDIALVAEREGIIVLPGIEASLDDGAHVLVINCGPEIEGISSLDELSEVRRPEHLIVPAHPFYPCFGLGRQKLEQWSDLFDAIEWSYFWNKYLHRANLDAAKFCKRRGIPLVGTGDIHLPRQMNRTYSIVEAQRDPVSIVRAIRAGLVEVVTEPLSLVDMALIMGELTVHNQLLSPRFWKRLPTVFADVYARRPHQAHELAGYA